MASETDFRGNLPRLMFSLFLKSRAVRAAIFSISGILVAGAGDRAEPIWLLETGSDNGGQVLLEGFDPANGWIIRPAGENPAKPTALQKWRSLSRPAPPPQWVERKGWQVWLGNQDRLSGADIGLTERHLTMAGEYFGLVLIPRSQVRLLRNLAAAPVYEGPAYGEVWAGGAQPNIAGEGTLRVPAGQRVAASFEGLPRRFHWRLRTAPTVDFTLRLPAGDPFRKGAFYRLQRTTGAWTLWRTDPDGAEDVIAIEDRSAFPDAAAEAEALWDVFADLDERRVSLFCDGHLVCDWHEPFDEDSPPVEHADNILALLADKTAFEVRWFLLAPWRSVEPRSPDRTALEAAADLITLANGDELQGVVRDIHRGLLSYQMAGRPLVLPVARVGTIFFKTSENEPTSAVPAETVRIRLFNGDILTVKPKHGEDEHLIADHAIVGECRLPWADIRRIERAPPNESAAP